MSFGPLLGLSILKFSTARVGPSRVRVADVGGEEFEEAHAGTFAGGGDEDGRVGPSVGIAGNCGMLTPTV